MSPRIIAFVLAVAFVAQSQAVAQDSPLAEAYGAGVHAYFDGAHSHAIAALTAAIDGGMKDARAYYFRGLTQARMGDRHAADADFALGATLEAADPAMTTVVSRSLQRIQGQSRLHLEGHRAKARLAAVSQQRARDEALYGRQRSEERRALTKQAEKAEEVPFEKTAPADAVKVEETEEKATEKKPAKAEPTDPFGDEAPPKANATTEPAEKAAESAEKAADPFEEQPKAKEAPAAKEDEPAVKEEEMPVEEAPAVKKPAEKKA